MVIYNVLLNLHILPDIGTWTSTNRIWTRLYWDCPRLLAFPRHFRLLLIPQHLISIFQIIKGITPPTNKFTRENRLPDTWKLKKKIKNFWKNSLKSMPVAIELPFWLINRISGILEFQINNTIKLSAVLILLFQIQVEDHSISMRGKQNWRELSVKIRK